MGPISVLLVEDNPGDRILIREFLGMEGEFRFRVEEASTLREAAGILDGNVFEVVLLDLSLPDSSGLETLRQLVGRYPEPAIVVLTGLDDERMAGQAVRYGAQDFLDKSYISPRWLVRAVTNAIERKRMMRHKESLLANLTAALAEIELLRKVVPVCAGCRKIRDREDHWVTLEEYVRQRGDEVCSRALCPECNEALYPFRLSRSSGEADQGEPV